MARDVKQRINISLAYPVYKPNHGLLFTQDNHKNNPGKFTHDTLGILGPDVLLSHSTGLTYEGIAICTETDTRISNNPNSNFSVPVRYPVPELLDARVTVILGSDVTAPDRSYDMPRHMFHCMHYQLTHYQGTNYISPGKVLEVVTIDSTRALGPENDIGSLEVGKKADIILVDMRKPHLCSMNMPIHRMTYFASGNDVDTVIVNGEILMRNSKVTGIDESEILNVSLLNASSIPKVRVQR